MAYFLTSATSVKIAVICRNPIISWFAIWSANMGRMKKLIGRYMINPIIISITHSIIDFFFESVANSLVLLNIQCNGPF